MIPARRLAVLCAFFLATAFFLYTMGEGRTVPLKRPVASFPEHIGPWRQVANEPLTAKVVAILGVDDYLNADYADAQGRRLNFYFSYFTRMDGSKAFHSPRNCMPGAGWDVISLEPLAVRIPGSEKKLSINRMVLQKGNRYQVVLYWYQGRGRVMRSEYSERVYRVLDSLFKHRTDGSFVRVMAPATRDSISRTTDWLLDFVRDVFPILSEYIPS